MPSAIEGRLTAVPRWLWAALLAAILLLPIVIWAAEGGKAGVSGEPVLRVGSQRGGTKAMMIASGALEGAPYRIEWSEFPAAQHLLEAIGADAVDVGAVGDAPFLFAYQSGAPIKAVQATRYEPRTISNAVLIKTNSPLRSAADLKSKRIATGRGSIGHFLLLKVLEREGLTPDAVTIVFLSPSDAKAAFASGSVDAWATWNPYVYSALLRDGARVLADGRDLMTSIGFMVAGDAAVKSKRVLLTDFLSRNARAQQWASTHTEAFAQLLASESGLPIDIARQTANRGLSSVPIDAALIDEERAVLETFRAGGAMPGRRPLERAFDPVFNESVPAA